MKEIRYTELIIVDEEIKSIDYLLKQKCPLTMDMFCENHCKDFIKVDDKEETIFCNYSK